MRRFVLDASVALAWFVDRPMPSYAERVRQMLIEGDRGVVPALWHIEVANGLAVAQRRRVIAAADVEICLGHIDNLVMALECSAEVVATRGAVKLARDYSISAYDAVYLLEALNGGLPIATLDRPLRTAAQRAAVEIVQ